MLARASGWQPAAVGARFAGWQHRSGRAAL